MSDGPTRWEWIQAVLDDEAGPPGGSTVRLTLTGLARFMDPSGGSCWPSAPLLARATRLGERTVRRDIEAAVESGWLEREPRGRGYSYRARIPAGHAGIGAADTGTTCRNKGGQPRQDVPVSRTRNPAPRAGVAKAAPRATAAPRAGGPRHHVPPKRDSEVFNSPVSTTSPSIPTLPPSTDSARGREDVKEERSRARILLRAVCLGGREETAVNGHQVGLGLLLSQWDDLVSSGVDPEELNGAIEVLGDLPPDHEDHPPDAWTLRWLRDDPARLSRAVGRWHRVR